VGLLGLGSGFRACQQGVIGVVDFGGGLAGVLDVCHWFHSAVILLEMSQPLEEFYIPVPPGLLALVA
jgi:hypothetical protein